MKKQLTMQSLTATHYDAPDHILQFEPGDGQKIFVTVRGLGPVDDEFYWDDEDNLARALAEVKEDDIEVQEPPMNTDKIIEESNLTWKLITRRKHT